MLLDKLLAHLAVEVQPFALCMVTAGWRLRLPGPPTTMLHYVLRGSGAVLGPQDDAHPVAPFWLSVVPKGAKHSLESGTPVQSELRVDDAPPPGGPVCHIVAGSSAQPDLLVACGLVSVRYGPSVGLFDHLKDVLSVNLSDQPQVGAAFQGILAEQAQPGAGQQIMLGALMTQCLVHLFRQLASSASSLPWLKALDDARLSRVLDQVLENPAAEHTVESLADVAGMSRSAFAERFAATFQRSPMTFVQHVRMQQAAHLLRQDATLSMDEIASRVGYSSRSHFSEAFRKHHGVAPNAFRTAH